MIWLRKLSFLIEKEFRQIFRDPAMVKIIFVLPIIQLFIFGYAVNTDLKNVRLSVLDHDNSTESRHLTESFFSSGYFIPGASASSPAEIAYIIARGKSDIAVWIPRDYTKSIARGQPASIGLTVDGQNSSIAGRARGYAEAVIYRESFRVLDKMSLEYPALTQNSRRIEAITRYFYNPQLESRFYMIPGIVVLIITIISGMMTGMAIVREKEIGTLEQLMVTPLSSTQIIIGKTVPFAAIAFFEIAFASTIATLFFKLPFTGSVWLLAGSSLAFLLVTLGSGLLVSTISSTQQQAMLTIWFFLIFGILMSGFFFPIENMPEFIRLLTYLNPLRYYITIVRGIFLKAITFNDALPNLIPMLSIGLIEFLVSVSRFTKRIK